MSLSVLVGLKGSVFLGCSKDTLALSKSGSLYSVSSTSFLIVSSTVITPTCVWDLEIAKALIVVRTKLFCSSNSDRVTLYEESRAKTTSMGYGQAEIIKKRGIPQIALAQNIFYRNCTSEGYLNSV